MGGWHVRPPLVEARAVEHRAAWRRFPVRLRRQSARASARSSRDTNPSGGLHGRTQLRCAPPREADTAFFLWRFAKETSGRHDTRERTRMYLVRLAERGSRAVACEHGSRANLQMQATETPFGVSFAHMSNSRAPTPQQMAAEAAVVHELCTANGDTIGAFATRHDLSRAMLWQIANGSKPLSLDYAIAIATAVGVPLDALSARLAAVVRAAARTLKKPPTDAVPLGTAEHLPRPYAAPGPSAPFPSIPIAKWMALDQQQRELIEGWVYQRVHELADGKTKTKTSRKSAA